MTTAGALFDTDSATEPAPPALVHALVQFGYSERSVREWTRERATTVLAKRRREAQQDLNHADARAAAQDAPSEPPSSFFVLTARIDAAVYLEQSLAARDPEQLLIALTYAVHPLSAVEVRDLAHLVAGQLRLHPVRGGPITEAEGGRAGT